MESKYFLWTLVIILNMLMLSSCLGSSEGPEIEYSADAQIYTFSISSRADTSNLLNSTVFTIDQVNGKIFNKELLPYKFHIDSVIINLSSSNAYSSFYNVALGIGNSEDAAWSQSDSVDINNLYNITTTAPDGETTKKYDFQLNIHDNDPYILSWENISEDYIGSIMSDQKTISYNNRFITYYISNGTVNAVSSSTNDGAHWSTASIIGLPPNILLSSLTVSENALYINDENHRVFGSTDGLTWTQTVSDFAIIANYGILPSDNNNEEILVLVDDNNEYIFAKTNDFSSYQLMEMSSETSTSEFPIRDFTSISINSPSSHTIKYIIIAGGYKSDNTANDYVWIIQEKNGKISDLKSKKTGTSSLAESTLFFYDNNTYLLVNNSGTNNLLYSDNYGLEWELASENQSLPSEMDFRKKASVITDNENYIWIFGGISETQTQKNDVWRGRLNKFAQD
jgi:hypothetical protein